MKKLKIFLLTFVILFILVLLTFIIIYIINLNYSNNTNVNNEKIFYELKSFESEIFEINENTEKYSTNELDNKLKEIYNSWSYIILDLNNLDNINREDLSEFGKEIDGWIISIKSKDKYTINSYIITIYSKIINYFDILNYDKNYTDILKAKYNLLIANNSIISSNWQLTKDSVEKSCNYIYNIIRNENNDNNNYTIEQIYIILNEMKNVVENKDSEVFNIKYKLVMEKINNCL